MRDIREYDSLVDKALSLGAEQAVVVATGELVVENRVALKCRFGCPHYGRSYSCPPRVPTVDQFRACLSEYSYALVAAFPSGATVTSQEGKGLLRALHDPAAPPEEKADVDAFYKDWNRSKQTAFAAILSLERAAFDSGEPLALALRPSRCTLCEKCDTSVPCRHPTRLRFSPESVGINLAETCRRLGLDLVFPFKPNPSHVGLVLLG